MRRRLSLFFNCVFFSRLTFFDELHKHGVVAADGEPEAIFIFLDDYASRDQTCERDKTGDKRDITASSKGAESHCNKKKNNNDNTSKASAEELPRGPTGAR